MTQDQRPAGHALPAPARVSVVIPAINEAENLRWLLPQLTTVDEVIVVDGESTDGTGGVVRDLCPRATLVRQRPQGKGAALWAGFAAATGDVIVMIDADGSMDPLEIDTFLALIARGFDVVKGSRNSCGGGSADLTFVRGLGNWMFVRIANALYGTGWSDLCYGYIALRRPALEGLRLHSDGFETEHPEHTVVPNDRKRGLSGARNCGVALTATPIVAFVDDDAVPEPDWVARLALAYRATGELHVLGLGGAIVPYWVVGRPSWFPVEFDWVVGCTYKGARTDPGPVRNMLGANMSFRTEALRQIGGFHEGIGRIGAVPLGCEETEACIRMAYLCRGGQVWYEPSARVHHRVPADRTNWRYLLRRCWAEGLSKGYVAALAGCSSALADERAYAIRTLPRAVAQAFAEAVRDRRAAPLGRAVAVMSGLALAGVGFAVGRLTSLGMRAEPGDSLGAPKRGVRRAGSRPHPAVSARRHGYR
jgi:glucosyl-dolichyl phosphate glucuronosyltransferase